MFEAWPASTRLIQCPSRDRAVAFYRAADLLAYPSHNETFGPPILEAKACGCPLVTSQVSSMPEIAGGAAIPPIPPPSPRPWWPG